tara:strand:+ start:4830 stop:5633 length:804 start_codon:yes stop_codon:yes gene_type:complete
MSYLTGYTIKPHQVLGSGEVLFTDGTNTGIMANQVTCEAYGYTYNRTTGTCSTFRFNTNLERIIANENNRNNGSGNTTELGSNTIQVNGSNNTTKGFNNNCLINGSGNEIANGVDNATVLGSNGRALRDGELVLGGGGIGTTSLFLLNTVTTDATSTALLVNGDSALAVIEMNKTGVYNYTVDILAFRTGGASGSGATADRIFLKLEGMVFGATVTETITPIVALGTVVGWTAATVFSGTDMSIKVTGAAAMDIAWQATARFNEMNL